MVHVIRLANTKQVECGHCKSLLEYSPSDVCENLVHVNEYEKFIPCPVCKCNVRVDSEEKYMTDRRIKDVIISTSTHLLQGWLKVEKALENDSFFTKEIESELKSRGF